MTDLEGFPSRESRPAPGLLDILRAATNRIQDGRVISVADKVIGLGESIPPVEITPYEYVEVSRSRGGACWVSHEEVLAGDYSIWTTIDISSDSASGAVRGISAREQWITHHGAIMSELSYHTGAGAEKNSLSALIVNSVLKKAYTHGLAVLQEREQPWIP